MDTARRLVATVLLVVFVCFYGLIAMEVGAAVAARTGGIWSFVYFIVAGFAWTVPAGAIIWWGWRRRPQA